MQSFPSNISNLKVVCRIKPPKIYDNISSSISNDPRKKGQPLASPASTSKRYTCIRNRTRSNSKDNSTSSPQNLQNSRHSRDNSINKRSSSRQKKIQQTQSITSNLFSEKNYYYLLTILGNSVHGCLQEDKKYCIFTTKERSNVVIACENAVSGKLINEQLCDNQDLNFFSQTLIGSNQSFQFVFDSVFNESSKQEKFYSSSIRPTVKSFIEGQNACVILFGPSESGKTYTLKGKTGMDRGILPRAVEDIFNIVKNSEDRDEDLELLKNEMMGSGYSADTQQQYIDQDYQYSARDRLGKGLGKQFEQDLGLLPERMFLKVSVYQIFVDKVIDLLVQNGNNQTVYKHQSQKGVKIDHYIDRESEEVVSKLKNISEKIVFTLEDFYSVLQEAFKNRRIESVSLQEQDLRKKSHFIINLTLMKRTQQRKLIEISHLNFVELSGSEQAVAEERFYKDSSVKQFVTKSFNSLSTQILKSALKKKVQVPSTVEDGDSKIVNCLRNTLTSTSNIVLVCCVNPGNSYYEHSLPALKFCARIRDCVLRKLSKRGQRKYGGTNNNTQTISINQSASIDKIEYGKDNSEKSNYFLYNKNIFIIGQTMERPKDNTQEIIQIIKQGLIQKQQKQQFNRNDDNYIDSQRANNYQTKNSQEFVKWAEEQLKIVEKLQQRIRIDNQSGSKERQNYVVLDELSQLKDKLILISGGQIEQNGRNIIKDDLMNTKHYQTDNMMIENNQEFQKDNKYLNYQNNQQFNPFQTMNFSPNHQQLEYQYKQKNNNDRYDLKQNNQQYNQIKTETSRHEMSQTPQFDYQTTQESFKIFNILLQQKNLQTIKTRDLEIQNKFIQPSYLQSNQHINNAQQIVPQNHFTSQSNNMLEIESTYSNYQTQDYSNQRPQIINGTTIQNENIHTYPSFAGRNSSIKIFDTYDNPRTQRLEGSALRINVDKQGTNNLVESYNNQTTSNKQQTSFPQILQDEIRTSPNKQNTFQVQNKSIEEDEYHGIRNKKPSININNNSNNLKDTDKGYSSTSLFGNNSKISQPKAQISGLYSTIAKEQKVMLLQQQQEFARQRKQLQNESVYGSDNEAINDISRLIRLNDFEGVKVRVVQIYKEKAEQEKLLDKITQQTKLLNEDIERKDGIIEEYEKVLKQNNEEYQTNIEEINNQKELMSQDLNSQNSNLQSQIQYLETQLKAITEEKEWYKIQHDKVTQENKSLVLEKEETEQKYIREKQEGDKMRSNYEILKEHELSIIKDYEGKKNKEISFYEQTVQDTHKQVKELQLKERDLEEQIYRQGQDLRKYEYDMEKLNQDKKYLSEQLDTLNQRLEKYEEEKQEIVGTFDQNERMLKKINIEKQDIEDERTKAFDEINKLHILIEEMERTIQSEQDQKKEERLQKEEKEKKELEQCCQDKDQLLTEYEQKESQLNQEIQQLSKMHDEIERNLTMLKAKEYDKVDFLRKCAELEAKLKYLQVDNEGLVKERNNLDLANVDLNRQKQELEQANIEMSSELEFFRNTHEDLLDKFDSKIEQITNELTKLKNENIQLKEKDKITKRQLKEIEQERDEYNNKLMISERKLEEFNQKLCEMEKQLRQVIDEKDLQLRNIAIKQSIDMKEKDENKKQLLDDIQNLIKDKRKTQQKQLTPNRSSQSSSILN